MTHVSPEELGILSEGHPAIMLTICFLTAVCSRLATVFEVVKWPGRPESRPADRSNFFAGHFLGGDEFIIDIVCASDRPFIRRLLVTFV